MHHVISRYLDEEQRILAAHARRDVALVREALLPPRAADATHRRLARVARTPFHRLPIVNTPSPTGQAWQKQYMSPRPRSARSLASRSCTTQNGQRPSGGCGRAQAGFTGAGEGAGRCERALSVYARSQLVLVSSPRCAWHLPRWNEPPGVVAPHVAFSAMTSSDELQAHVQASG